MEGSSVRHENGNSELPILCVGRAGNLYLRRYYRALSQAVVWSNVNAGILLLGIHA
jgi:hypothetical protein